MKKQQDGDIRRDKYLAWSSGSVLVGRPMYAKVKVETQDFVKYDIWTWSYYVSSRNFSEYLQISGYDMRFGI